MDDIYNTMVFQFVLFNDLLVNNTELQSTCRINIFLLDDRIEDIITYLLFNRLVVFGFHR